VWEETVALRAVGGPVRQIAVRDGRYDKPTVLITNDPDTPAEDLLFRYGERSVGELEMVTTINDMRLAGSDDADLDLTLAVIAETSSGPWSATCRSTATRSPTPSGGICSASAASCRSTTTR
jgi:hypothetical protein